MDIFIDGPAGKIDLRHKGLDAAPKQVVVLTQGANLSGQLGYDLSFDGRTDYSMMDALVARGYGVVTFAVRGYRKSELNHSPLDVGTEQAIEDLCAVMDWVRDQGFATPHLLGWSWGGRIVGHYASRFPDRLDRLVLMDPALGGGNKIPFVENADWWQNTYEYFFNKLEADLTDLDGRTQLARQAEDTELNAPNGIRVENEKGSVQVDPAALRNPTLMLYGHAAAKQDYMQGGAVREEFFGRIDVTDKALVIVPGGGDYAHLQKPRQRMFAVIADFLGA
ncbi:alpha/beta fold hydrolase [Novosphingobium sp. CECT 9465]|uniref:alpha/beta fold hydrolase n=1 Tax=Novosphingobium sp. CECT 9465 TaxID=2829794 RepID=UPI001E49C9D9|nr:alpha/beta fold hydrolase [Novosphingobium sp. CECT 9465]CAH0495260.1 hypothetical protein NVSP9465_00266 [Novosphingobium sp. CECT 9465]